MSAFRDMVIDIQDDILRGELSFGQISVKHNVSYRDVDSLAHEMIDQFCYDDPDVDQYRAEDQHLESMYEQQFDVEF